MVHEDVFHFRWTDALNIERFTADFLCFGDELDGNLVFRKSSPDLSIFPTLCPYFIFFLSLLHLPTPIFPFPCHTYPRPMSHFDLHAPSSPSPRLPYFLWVVHFCVRTSVCKLTGPQRVHKSRDKIYLYI